MLMEISRAKFEPTRDGQDPPAPTQGDDWDLFETKPLVKDASAPNDSAVQLPSTSSSELSIDASILESVSILLNDHDSLSSRKQQAQPGNPVTKDDDLLKAIEGLGLTMFPASYL
ncbi:hypothetical protein HDU96_009206 [Phlyctochytrium bullatum]|nr:hypothetical protein HDU96_009206 [Phlyctochytrium bullatum]